MYAFIEKLLAQQQIIMQLFLRRTLVLLAVMQQVCKFNQHFPAVAAALFVAA
jgi:hypothetical protein